jgi:hypothetical protein
MSSSLLTLITALGWAGAVAGLVAYYMVSKGRWSSSSWAFQCTNIAGAIIMTVVAGVNGVWPSAAANVAWIVIGIQTLMMAQKNRLAEQAAAVAAPAVVPAVAISTVAELPAVLPVAEPADLALDAVADVELPLVEHPLDLAAAERAAERAVELTETLEFRLPERELAFAGSAGAPAVAA